MAHLVCLISSTSSRAVERPVPINTENEKIYGALAAVTCKVVWKIGNYDLVTSGSFIKYEGKIQVLTCFHEEKWKTASITIKVGAVTLKNVTLATNVNVSLVEQNDLCVLHIHSSQNHYFSFSENFNPPKLGETVYFAGYPFGKEDPIIHEGRISSLNNNRFTIDGTVVSGNSGGIVVAKRNEKLELLGVISSQAVDMTEKLIKASQVNLQKYDIVAMGDESSSFGSSDIRSVLGEVIKNFLSNTSTGIGTATRISELSKILTVERSVVNDESLPKSTKALPILRRSGPIGRQISRSDGLWDVGAVTVMNGMKQGGDV